MKLFSYAFLALTILFVACESSNYSDEEEAKLEEAQKLHNEALAVFAETKDLLAEITETRADLIKRHGLSGGDSANQTTGVDSTAVNSQQAQRSNAASDTSSNQQTTETGEPTDFLNADAQQALDDLNKAQGELMAWMREIYGVPAMDGGYDDQKAEDGRSIGKDPNSAMLSTEIEIKPMPESSGVDEILEKQKEQKEEIVRIQEDLKRAIKNAKGQ